MKAQIANALPKHIKPDRMIRIITTELRKNPQLATCDKGSFLSAIMQASQLGLEPSRTLIVGRDLIVYKLRAGQLLTV